jgi:hypothetical protein
MGVSVRFQELGPEHYSGRTFAEHSKLASLFEGKVIALDGHMLIAQVCYILYLWLQSAWRVEFMDFQSNGRGPPLALRWRAGMER